MKGLHFKYPVVIVLFLFGFINSCTIDGTNWDVDGLAPVMQTTLDWNKMVGAENLDVASDSALTLHFEDTVYRFELDTLTQLSLQTVVNSYTWTYPTLDVPPGTTLPTQTFNISLDLNDLELVETIIKQGSIVLTIKSGMPRKLKFKYYIPKATLNGNQFELLDSIDAAPLGDTIIYQKKLNATDFLIDLRGPNNIDLNRIDIFVDVTLDPNGSPLTLNTNQFLFEITNQFEDLLPEYGRGYLGQFNFQSGNTFIDLDFLNSFKSGYIDIQEVSLDLKLINNIGADVRFKPYLLKGFNDRTGAILSLNHPSIGNTINVNRATQTGLFSNPVSPSVYNLQFNALNSNLDQFIELLPNRIELNADMFLNPYGNISGYNDFYYYDYPAMVYMDLIAPLNFAINDIKFVDTLDNFLFNESQLDHVVSGDVKVLAENKFPLEVALQVYTLNESSVVTDSLLVTQTIDPGIVNVSGRVTNPSTSNLVITATDSKLNHLKLADRLLIKAYFVTLPSTQLLQMYSDYYLKLKLIGDIRYNVEL